MKTTVIENILKLFNVSNEEADLYASEFIDLVCSKGGELNLSVIESQVPKVFGSRLEWKSEEVRLEVENRRKSSVQAYNNYIQSKNKGKW